MSLDNAFSREELERWAQRAVRELGRSGWSDPATCASSKSTGSHWTWCTKVGDWFERPPEATGGSVRM